MYHHNKQIVKCQIWFLYSIYSSFFDSITRRKTLAPKSGLTFCIRIQYKDNLGTDITSSHSYDLNHSWYWHVAGGWKPEEREVEIEPRTWKPEERVIKIKPGTKNPTAAEVQSLNFKNLINTILFICLQLIYVHLRSITVHYFALVGR